MVRRLFEKKGLLWLPLGRNHIQKEIKWKLCLFVHVETTFLKISYLDIVIESVENNVECW